jgi:hypothetical protein
MRAESPRAESAGVQVPVSIVIPAALGERSAARLFSSLERLPSGSEIFVVSPRGAAVPASVRQGSPRVVFIEAENGRASCLNAGARASRGEYLWFLHADSVPTADVYPALQRVLAKKAEGLSYFDLLFLGDGPPLVKLSEWGARFRSRLFGLPFGDQGFLLKRETFFEAGGFSEDAPYGEDNLLVWKLKRRGVPVRRAGASLYTSARNYWKLGWWRTVCLYQRRWIGQAIRSMRREA